jgi:transposase
MRKTVIAPHLSMEALKERMCTSPSREQYRRWQVIYIMSKGTHGAEEVADLVGISQGTVYQWVHRYNHRGPKEFLLEGRGGRRGGLLTWEEEEALLSEISERAMNGLVVIAQPVRECAERRLGHAVSKDYAYDLLHRHGWRKISPRPRHPKAQSVRQEEFKKNSLSLWKPPQRPSRRKIHDH